MACLSAMIYARLRGIRYLHSPLTRVAHAPPGISAAAWAAAWEEFFSPGAGEDGPDDAADQPEFSLRKPHRRRPKRGRLNVVAHCHKVTDRHPDAWAELAPGIRRKYRLTPKPAPLGADDDLAHVAVHLRRGDVGATGEFAERFTPAARVLPVLEKLVARLGPDRCRVHLFSQGEPGDFREFAPLEPRLHLDDDVFESFHAMATADVLVTAKSTFSHLAGILNDGAVIHEPFWHPPLPHWHHLSDEPGTLAERVAAAVSRADPA